MFAILFEVLLIEIQEEIHHCALCWLGGEGRISGAKIVNKTFVNKLAFPNYWGLPQRNPKSYPESDFLTRKSHFASLWHQIVTFGVTFRVTLGGDPKSHLLVAFQLLLIFRVSGVLGGQHVSPARHFSQLYRDKGEQLLSIPRLSCQALRRRKMLVGRG